MSQLKITEMPTASSVNLSDYVPIVQEGINKKVSVEALVGDEADRVEAENKRVQAEADRVAAEKSRVQFEEQRKRDENTRVSNENERTLKEEERISNENSRQSNEEDRVSSESARVSNENTRIENENARIEAENARIEYDLCRKNAVIGGFLEQEGTTYSGTASDYGVELYKMAGKTTQQTTNGYQLFDASKIQTKIQGGATVTNNGDGSFTISGNGNLTETYQTYFVLDNETSKSLVKSGTINLVAASTNPYLFVSFKNNAGIIKEVNAKSNSVSSIGLTNEQINSDGFYIQLGFWGVNGQPIKTGTVKPMLYQDGDGTWEQFTGGQSAPNLDYPMEIENVNIKNILSTNSLMNESNIEIRGCFIQSNDIITDYDNTWNISKYIPIPSGVSKLNFKTKGISPSICFYGKNKEYISGESYNSRIVFSVDIPSNAYFMRLSISNEYVDKAYYCCLESQTWKNNEIETSLTLAQDDIYQNGTITRARKQVTFDGSSDESWKNLVANTRVQCQLDTVIRANSSITVNGYCNRVVYRKIGNANELKNNEFTIISSEDFGGTRLIIRIPSDISTLEEWKTWLSTHNLVVEYELATPTTEEYQVPTIPSYYPFTNVSTDSIVEPAETVWRANTTSGLAIENKERLDQIQFNIEALEKRIAALEKQLIGG